MKKKPIEPIAPVRRTQVSMTFDLYDCTVQELIDKCKEYNVVPNLAYIDAVPDRFGDFIMKLAWLGDEPDEHFAAREKVYESDRLKYLSKLLEYNTWLENNMTEIKQAELKRIDIASRKLKKESDRLNKLLKKNMKELDLLLNK